MSELVIASSETDAYAAVAVKQHHAAMAGAPRLRIKALFAARRTGFCSEADVASRS